MLPSAILVLEATVEAKQIFHFVIREFSLEVQRIAV